MIETRCLRRESAKAGRRKSSNVDEVGGVETGWGASGDDAREKRLALRVPTIDKSTG